MRLWLRITLGLLLLGVVALGICAYLYREPLARQWACYRVGAARSFDEAQAEIAWFETGEDRDARVGELVAQWGAGNTRFDLFVARHLGDAACTDALREAFSHHIGKRKVLLARWAHHWSYRARSEPSRQVASVLDYFDALFRADRSKTVTWREVLDLQAAFQLLEAPQRAEGLSPDNWQEHYRVWQETRPEQLPKIERPPVPLPDWQGPLPPGV